VIKEAVMSRFFYKIPATGAEDELGEFADESKAREDAYESVRELVSEGVREGWDMSDWKMLVTDESGRTVVELPFSEALQPKRT
jgi:hypothetical protein